MPKTKALPTPLKERLVAAVGDGMSHREAAKVFRVSKAMVTKCIARMREFNSVKRLPKSGRPKKTSKQTERRIRRAVLVDPTATSKALANDICPAVSPQTVRRVLKRAGLVARRPKKKPFISLMNRQAVWLE